MKFEIALQDFIDHINDVNRKRYEKANIHPDLFAKWTIDEAVRSVGGRKYEKLTNGRAVVAFIEKKTGDIFKPASWSAPAKHARGNIYVNGGKDAVSASGHIVYMR